MVKVLLKIPGSGITVEISTEIEQFVELVIHPNLKNEFVNNFLSYQQNLFICWIAPIPQWKKFLLNFLYLQCHPDHHQI